MPCESCYIGDKVLKHIMSDIDDHAAAIVAGGATYRALERELGRKLQ